MNQQSASNHPGAYGTRPVIMGEQAASGKLSAYGTPPVIFGEQVASDKLSAYNIRSDSMKHQSAFDKQSAYSTGSVDVKQESAFNNLDAYGTSSATVKQENSLGNLSAYTTGPATIKQASNSNKLSPYSAPFATSKHETASGKLSAYEISSVTRKRYSDVLHVGQNSISRGDECLDPDCGSFCKNIKGKSIKTELEFSEDDFSLNMDEIVNAFGGPFGLGSLPPIPENATASHPSQGGGPSLRDVGLTNGNPAINDPNLLVYPDLQKRVGRYFEYRKPTPDGWTWSVNDTQTSRFAPAQSSASVALTDSSTVASGSVTGFSQAGPSRPLTPHLGSLQMDSDQMDLLQTDFLQMNLAQMDAMQMNPLQMDAMQMNPLQMDTMGLPLMNASQMDALTFGPGERADAIGVISKMREIQTDGVQPFGPSRFLNNPDGNPTGNANGNYLGTLSSASNQMASLPDHLNTCIWVEGAPADMTYFEMLRSIRHCGKIYSVHINPPKEKHFTAAAKIAFCTRVGAERFIQQAHSGYGIIIRGRRICVRWNRNKYRENFNRAESRVLKISGPADYVNFKVLGEYFGRLFYFNLIWVEEVKPGVMIWEFSSILAQAHSAKQAIEREPAMMHMVNIKYERDPCE
ncbi:hypothetical protein VE03_04379 [Pseudogymnoascus sp. 23342-1-I1]|nr:hypothetical protein VE03_04379 [Pseudogymnoascus sp. 23342-1-I1]